MDATENTGKTENASTEEMQVNEAVPAYVRDGYYTYADYLTWDDDRRWELIDGKPYLMSAPSANHQIMLGAIHFQFTLFLTVT